MLILLAEKLNVTENYIYTYRYVYKYVVCCLMLYTCWAHTPLVLFPFRYYNRNSGKQFKQTIIEWPMVLVVVSNARFAKKNLLSSSHLPPYSHCVLVRFKARLLCIYVKLKAHINIIWNSQHHIKIYETTKCIPIFMLIVYIFIVTHLSVRSNWTQYLFVHCYARNCIRFIFFILEFVTVKMSVQKKKEERHCICTTGMIDVYQ